MFLLKQSYSFVFYLSYFPRRTSFVIDRFFIDRLVIASQNPAVNASKLIALNRDDGIYSTFTSKLRLI